MATRYSINRVNWEHPLWCLLAVTACSTHPGAVDRKACHEAKGTVEVVFGVRTCVVEFADGGHCPNPGVPRGWGSSEVTAEICSTS
jgi:hypothetical protein